MTAPRAARELLPRRPVRHARPLLTRALELYQLRVLLQGIYLVRSHSSPRGLHAVLQLTNTQQLLRLPLRRKLVNELYVHSMEPLLSESLHPFLRLYPIHIGIPYLSNRNSNRQNKPQPAAPVAAAMPSQAMPAPACVTCGAPNHPGMTCFTAVQSFRN